MFEVIGSHLLGIFMGIMAQPAKLEPIQLLAWQDAEIFNLPTQTDPKVEEIVTQYLDKLASQGFIANRQGVWMQSDWAFLANHQGKIPASAASLTKIATTLAVLSKWQTDHRFETKIYRRGEMDRGTLRGDLIVEGSGDPFFIWEEAIALGNTMNQLGIRKVTGNLIIVGNFSMNFKTDAQVAGQLLQQGLNASRWTPAVTKQYQELPANTPRPQVAIAGNLQVKDSLPEGAELILGHQSMTLAEILKQMNIYSNNVMAEMLAESVGGGKTVAQIAAKAAKVPETEIQLINGSGLGVDNRISPRTVCNMLSAIEEKLASSPVKVTDLFPVAGRDTKGTMLLRKIPLGTAVKTGTLREVSALAGLLPTEERGNVCFAVINYGGDIEKLRHEQDNFLQKLAEHWQVNPSLTMTNQKNNDDYVGNPNRNLI